MPSPGAAASRPAPRKSQLAQAVIDVVAAETARDAARAGTAPRPSPSAWPGIRAPPAPCVAIASAGLPPPRSAPSPSRPASSAPSMRTIGAVTPLGRVHALEAEAVAVRDPGLVDLLVLARHHAHQLAAQHVREEIGAEAVVRARPAAAASSPRRAPGSGTACCSARRPGTGR